jgi:acetyl esterase/lipase
MHRRSFLLTSLALPSFGQLMVDRFPEQQQPTSERGRALAEFARSLKIERGLPFVKRPQGELTLNIYSPAGKPSRPLPCVLNFGLSAFLKNETTYRWDLDNLMPAPTANLYPPYLAKNRVVVVANLRLSSEAMFPAQIHDARCAMRWVRKNADRLGIDPARIALFGASASGCLSSLLALTAGTGKLNDPDCNPTVADNAKMVCSLSGIYDFEYYKNVDPGDKSLFVNVLPPYLGKSDRLYWEASPAAYVHAGAPPFLLTHGLQDQRVPFSQMPHFAALRKKAGVVVETLSIENYQHGPVPGKLPVPSVEVIDERIETFFQRHLDM